MTNITIGREQFYEGLETSVDGTTVSIVSQESSPPLTRAILDVRKENLTAMLGQHVPIVFERNSSMNGYYLIDSAEVSYMDYDDVVVVADWSISAERLGTHSEVEVGTGVFPLDRNNAHSVAGTTWHAASVGATAYDAGASEPSLVVRTGDDGDVPVYLDVASKSVRWTVSPENFYRGAPTVRTGGLVLAGTQHRVDVDGWELSNGLVRVSPNGAALDVDAYEAGQWRSQTFTPRASGNNLTGSWEAAAVIVNTPEQATVRLTRQANTGVGRITLDVTLRRGSRLAQCYMQTNRSLAFGVETGAQSTVLTSGYVLRDTTDANGNRWMLGSPNGVTETAGSGRITLADTRALAFYAGHVLDHDTAGAGETPLSLVEQYMGTPSVKERIVKR